MAWTWFEKNLLMFNYLVNESKLDLSLGSIVK